MNRSIALNVVKWLAAIFIFIFISYQIYISLYNPLKTDTAIYYETIDGVTFDAVIIRNETLINSAENGVISYTVEEGKRVSKGGTIAKVYSDESSAKANSRLEQLDGQIATLKELQTYNDVKAADLDALNSRINKAFLSLLADSQKGNYSDVADLKSELLRLLNRKQIVTGETSDFAGLIESLQAEKNNISGSVTAAVGELKSPTSGYFISAVDGYESKFSTEKLNEIKPDDLREINTSINSDKTVVGKVVSDYEWYIAATIPLSESYELAKGSKQILKTGISTVDNLEVTVNTINRDTAGDMAVVVFSCKYMNSELSGMRAGEMSLIKSSYKGLKVNKSAVRMVDGKKGVFVRSGMQAKFVEVNVLYAADNYMVCEYMTSNSSVLRLYDEVIVKGKNLYDGKIIG